MASLDLNQLINQSVAQVTSGKTDASKETNESAGFDVDLENVGKQEEDASTSNLALDLESVEDQIQFDIPAKIFEDVKGALGAGIGTYAVLEARGIKRVEEAAASAE